MDLKQKEWDEYAPTQVQIRRDKMMKTKFNFEIVFLQNLNLQRAIQRTQITILIYLETEAKTHVFNRLEKLNYNKSLSFQQQERERERERERETWK